jgi:hypothetical protein
MLHCFGGLFSGGLELLAARAMAMMVSLSMFSKTPFMDHIATDAVCQPLAREIIDRAFRMTGASGTPDCQ